MTRLVVASACTFVRAWTRLYTWGLPDHLRLARVEEIDSDLWERQHDTQRPGGVAMAMEMLARLAAGTGDDLRWRSALLPPRTAALFATAAALVLGAVVWMYAQWLGPGVLPEAPPAPAFVVSGRPGLPPPPPPPPPPSRPASRPR